MSPLEILVPNTFPQNLTQNFSSSRGQTNYSSMIVDDEVLVTDSRSKISPAQAVDSKLQRTAHRAEEYNRGTHFVRNAARSSKIQ